MANSNESRDSKLRAMIKNGSFAEQFTQNGWFVKIKPALSIDRVCFSFVKKGSNGKESFDIYMAAERFILWCEDIKDRVMLKVITEEKKAGEKYPKTYKYITGSNGEKSVGICPSTSESGFATINGTIVKDGKKIYANVPVDYFWLRDMARRFLNISIYWENEIANLAIETMKSNSARYKDADTEEEYTGSENITSSQPTQQTVNKPVQTLNEVVELECKTNGEVQIVKGDWGKVEILIQGNTDPAILYFKPEGIEKLGKENWEYILNKSAEKAIKLHIKAEKSGDNYLFVERVA